MTIRSRDFVGIAEGIKSHELSTKGKIEQLKGRISELSGRKSSLNGTISYLEAAIAAAYEYTDEDGAPDYGLISSLEAQKGAARNELLRVEEDLDSAGDDLVRYENELDIVLEEKAQSLFEIQERARITSQNIRASSGMYGAYAAVGSSLQGSLRSSLSSLSRAATILGGTVNGGDGFAGNTAVGQASNSSPRTASNETVSQSPLSAFKGTSGKAMGGWGTKHSSSSSLVGLATPATIGAFTHSYASEADSSMSYTSNQASNTYIMDSFSSADRFSNDRAGVFSSTQESSGLDVAMISAQHGSDADIGANPSRYDTANCDSFVDSSFFASIASTFKAVIGKAFNNDGASDYEKPTAMEFCGFIIEDSNMGGYFVAGNNYDRYREYRNSFDAYSYSPLGITKTINAREIEGIHINNNEANDQHLFWARGQEYSTDSETYFARIASFLPELYRRLKSGETIDSIRLDPMLDTCYNFYFSKPVDVYEVDGFYEFAGTGGRHRCMAAQKLGYDIPVNVVGRRSLKKDLIHNKEPLSISNFPENFLSTKMEYENTKRLTEFVNSISNSDKRVMNLLHNLNRIVKHNSNDVSFCITHEKKNRVQQVYEDVNGRRVTKSVVLNIPYLYGNDPTGQVQTTLHELTHLIDVMLKQRVEDFDSPLYSTTKDVMKNALKQTDPSPGLEVNALFSEYRKQVDNVKNECRKRYESFVSEAMERLRNDGNYERYFDEVTKEKEAMDSMYNYEVRNLMKGGICQLEDIYDALSGGKLRDSGQVVFGHGVEYFSSVDSRIVEIVANYASLSITRPDLILMLKRDKPELVLALEDTIDIMNERVAEYENN